MEFLKANRGWQSLCMPWWQGYPRVRSLPPLGRVVASGLRQMEHCCFFFFFFFRTADVNVNCQLPTTYIVRRTNSISCALTTVLPQTPSVVE